MAVSLTAVGLYGLLSYRVGRGTHEIGMRMALGASRENILLLVLRHGIVLGAVGVITGVAAAIVVTRILESLLYEVKTADPITYGTVVLVFVLVFVVATWIPARRAMDLDPMTAIRQE